MISFNFFYTGKKKKNNVVISEGYPESEYNPSRDVLDGDGRIRMEDLLGPLQDKPGFGKLRKRMDQLKKSEVIEAPLPQAVREKVERGTAYKISQKEITKWEPIVKRNREAPTIYFDEDTDLGFSTVGAIASEFEPRTEFEKKMASLISHDNVMEAHRKDGSRLLELNKVWKFYIYIYIYILFNKFLCSIMYSTTILPLSLLLKKCFSFCGTVM